MANIQIKDDDVISYCSSFSGETWSSRRRRNTCSLREHNYDTITRKLREPSLADNQRNCTNLSPTNNDICGDTMRKRFNNSFHHFRFVVVILTGASLGIMIFLRISLAVAIISMVNQTALYLEEHPNKTMDDFLAEGYSEGGEFLWNNEIQQMLMSWYMLAYTLPQLPLTKVANAVGSRKAMPLCLLICALSTLFTPLAAYQGWQWVMALRLLQGVGASAVVPLLLSVVESWMPYEEISLGLTCTSILQNVLTSVSTILVGHLCDIHWSLAFYVPGAATIVFCIVWLIFVTDKPDENYFTSSKELDLICGCSDNETQNQIKCVDQKPHDGELKNKSHFDLVNLDGKGGGKEKFAPPTWVDVLRVPCFYAYIIVWIFYCSSQTAFQFILPTYLRQFLKISLSLNGIYCFMIQSGCLVAVLWPHSFLRILEHSFGLSLTAAIRLSYVVTCVMSAGTMIFVGAFHADQIIVLFINRCFQQSSDVFVTGTLMRNFSKTGISSEVFSMVNTVSNLSVLFTSTLIGYVLDHTGQSVEAWSWIFAGLGLVQLIMMTSFCTLIRAEPVELRGKKIAEDNQA